MPYFRNMRFIFFADFGYIKLISQKAVVLGTLHVFTDFAKTGVPIVSGTTPDNQSGAKDCFDKHHFLGGGKLMAESSFKVDKPGVVTYKMNVVKVNGSARPECTNCGHRFNVDKADHPYRAMCNIARGRSEERRVGKECL